MRLLDLDMDYFMDNIATDISEDSNERLPEEYYGSCVWTAERIIDFLENHLGLSKTKKLKGRIVSGHNESLLFWKDLIQKGDLVIPFEVIHVDSHADLGLGYSSWQYILDRLLLYPVIERPLHNRYINYNGNESVEGIGDYLLFAIAYQWISKLTYCANPNGDKNDYVLETLKNFQENYIWDKPVQNILQLVHNSDMERPECDASDAIKEIYFNTAKKDPEVPMLVIPTIEDVQYDGDFDYVVMAQSPNYTPASADFIMDVFREYIEEI